MEIRTKSEMKSKDVTDLYFKFKDMDIEIWLDGGWAVDALLNKQTRTHGDLDIVVQEKDIPRLRNVLKVQGYNNIARDDTSAWNFVLGDRYGHLIDIHVIVFDEYGNGIYGPKDKGVMYPAASLTGSGMIDGRMVNCISPKFLVEFHTGYTLRENDYKDVSALCEKFNLEYPEEYKHLKI